MIAPTPKAGFSVLEVMAAIAISGFLLVGAHSVLTSIADSTEWITEMRASSSREANADLVLRRLIGSTEAATVNGATVLGDHEKVTLSTWCDVPGGWRERCKAMIEIHFMAGAGSLTYTLRGTTISVRDGFSSGTLRYLVDSQTASSWPSVWNSEITTPRGIVAIVDKDTLIFRIGDRG